MSAWDDFSAAAATVFDRERLFARLCALAQAEIGAKLFTVMRSDPEARVSQRLWSNMPDPCPPQGTKAMPVSDWTERVLYRRETFVANTIEEIAPHFSDHELIRSLGCESCINLPVIFDGRVLGTLNCLDAAGHYTPERVARAACLVPAGALCLLRDRAAILSGDR